MGQKGRDLVKEKYSWEVVAKKHVEVYEEVLSECNPLS
jgi:glycosyltransferase involved in cell wall biosynthesis